MQEFEQGNSKDAVLLAIVGDMEICREAPESAFEKVLPALREADVRFGGLEASMSDKGEAVSGKIVMRHSPSMIEGYLAGGFDVVAFASNHCMDYGIEPFVETMELLERRGIQYTGSGRNIEEARKPVIVERGGNRIGFLSYVLNLPLGWGANPIKPGVAPIRQDPLFAPPYVNEEDLEAMVADIERTRPLVDVLLTSFHWGSSQSRTLTLSQKAVAHAAVDAGADIVIGHHPHIIQGIEVYKGKSILYALGNFVLDHNHPMFMPTVRESIFVNCLVEDGSLSRVSFRPVLLEKDGSPRLLSPGEAKCDEILTTIQKLSQKLKTPLDISNGEAIVISRTKNRSV